MLIGVIILIKPIKDVKPIPNYILTLLYIEAFKYTLINF